MCGMSNLKCYFSVRGLTTKIFNTKCDCNIKVLNIIEFWIQRYDHPTINKAICIFCPIEISQIKHLIGFFVHWGHFVMFKQCKNYWILNHFCDWQYNNIIKFIGEFGFYGLKTYILCYNICWMA